MECFEMLKEEFDDNATLRACVFVWHKQFSVGKEKAEEDERDYWPVTIGTERKLM